MRHTVLLAVCWTLIGLTLWETRSLLHSWWRWLCCRTGHHRETVRVENDYPGIMADWLVLACMDCPRRRVLCKDRIPSPSRRYALRRTP